MTEASGRLGRWVVIREGDRARWGGDLRRRNLFSVLASRTQATVIDRWGTGELVRATRGARWRAVLRASGAAPRLASSEQLPSDALLDAARRFSDPVAVGIYDDAIAQLEAFGITAEPDRIAALRRRREQNEALFRWHVVPTASFARLAGLDASRVIVGGNGTNASHVRPGPWPDRPTIGLVSGAGPGRGIETLVAAARLVRGSVPDLRLLLWLVGTSGASETWLDRFRSTIAEDSWIEVAAAGYDVLGAQLQRATVLTIAHPANSYMDVALPVKLFDSMAAGRPLVVTPRTETRAIVERHGAGIVTAGDGPEDLAAGALRVLGDDGLARELGAAARTAAETTFDWPIVAGRVADEILRREGLLL
jgi:glycosyltransferase involved in cell wall biosynthesis